MRGQRQPFPVSAAYLRLHVVREVFVAKIFQVVVELDGIHLAERVSDTGAKTPTQRLVVGSKPDHRWFQTGTPSFSTPLTRASKFVLQSFIFGSFFHRRRRSIEASHGKGMHIPSHGRHLPLIRRLKTPPSCNIASGAREHSAPKRPHSGGTMSLAVFTS